MVISPENGYQVTHCEVSEAAQAFMYISRAIHYPARMMDIGSYMPTLLWWASGLSLVSLVATVLAVPLVVARLPVDYFSQLHRVVLPPDRSLPGLLLMGAKNLLGAVLVILGAVMLFTPGQGLLTLLVGLLLMNFPGKYRLERALVARPGVFRGLNWLRQRRGVAAFEHPVKK